MGATRARPGSAPAVGRDVNLVAEAEGMLSEARQDLKSIGLLKGLKPVEQKRLRQVFKMLDVNCDGRVTAADLRSAMRRDGMLCSLKMVEEMLWEICEHRVERGVSFREFALCYVRAKKGMHEPHRLYTYLFYKMMDEENAGDDPDDIFKESGLRKDAVVKYLAPQVGQEQLTGYVNALFGSALGEEEAAKVKRKSLFSADLTDGTGIKRSATDRSLASTAPDRDRGSVHHDRHEQTHSSAQDIIPAQTFCRVAQSCLWKSVPDGKPNLVAFPPLEVRRPITVRMKEQTAVIREQFKIIEAEENLQKSLRRKKLQKLTTTEIRHQKAVEMKERAARIREEFGESLRVRLKVHSEDFGEFVRPEQEDEGDVQFAAMLGVGVPELQNVKDVFFQLDKDGNGRIDVDEFRMALGKLLDEKDALENTHVKRIWEHLCIPPMKDVPFVDFAKWYVKHFVQHGGKPDIKDLLGQTRKVWRTDSRPSESAAWHPDRTNTRR
jgi:Ca2+-binding EF-hand superfamily protein